MFEELYTLDSPHRKGDFKLKLPICSSWKGSSHRLLVILETVDGKDLSANRLLTERSRKVLTNVIKEARKSLRVLSPDSEIPTFAFAAINFNDRRTFDLEREQRRALEYKFKDRVIEAIKKLKPTHILISGGMASNYLLSDVENLAWKRGWVFKREFGPVECKVVCTLDLEPLYSNRQNKEIEENEDDEEFGQKEKWGVSNLLGLVVRNLTHLMAGRHLYSLKHIKPKPVYIDTVERFDRMMEVLRKHPRIAWDTEDRNLTVLKNSVYMMQFAVNADRGFVVPMYHPKTPFSPKSLTYIHKELRQFFAERPQDPFKYFITINGAFDLMVARSQLKIPVILKSVWEVTAGEHALDENIKFLNDKTFRERFPDGKSAWNLRAILTSYRNDWYFKAAFSKEDRGNLGQRDPDDPEVLEYTSMDVQCLHGIHDMQLARAETMKLGDKNYKPYFSRLIRKQMSNTVHTISHMQTKGAHVDMFYLAFLKSSDSPLVMQWKEEEKELYELPSVKKANALLTKQLGEQEGQGLFGSKTPWIFNIGKPLHQQTLFFDVMELKPLSHTKKEKKPQVNKPFQKAYRENYPEVEKFAVIQDIKKLWGTYIKGWWNKLKESADSLTDGRLRPSYGFIDVVTGRSSSRSPNLQQVPTRSKIAKYIKRLFIASKGCVLVKYDYSAHEVRLWAIIAKDDVLADLFRIGQKLRQEYRKNPTPELLKRIKTEGDVHIINVKLFFNKVVDKTHFLRDAIKTTIFGVIYCKGPKSLANELNNRNKEVGAILRGQLRELKVKLEKEKTEELLKKKTMLLAQLEENKNEKPKDKEYAQKLIEKLFSRYTKGKQWIEWAKESVASRYYSFSPLGRRRNLWGVLTGIDPIIAAMQRRGVNSPVQGMASETGMTACRLVAINFYEFIEKFYGIKEMMFLPGELEKFVHDALYSEVRYKFLIPYLYILQWTATYGVAKYYKEEFGLDFNIEPEISIELGCTEDNLKEWDWTNKSLIKVIRETLAEQVQHQLLEEDEVDKVFAEILEVTKNKEIMHYLNTKYPILGVKAD